MGRFHIMIARETTVEADKYFFSTEGRRPRRPQASSPANGKSSRRQSPVSPDRGSPLPPKFFSRKEHKEIKTDAKRSVIR